MFGKEKKNEVDFLRYLDEREKLHGKVYTLDELEIANHFLEVGNFHEFDEADRISFDITSTSIFDKHYFTEHGVKYPIKDNDRNGPYYVEIKRQGNKIVTGIKGFPDTYKDIDIVNNQKNTDNITEKSDKDRTKIGRNDPCPCGSGKKYKKCCGAK
ncbi:MAG: SEC-C metal-binding domain-containing protein [bacterium]